MKKKFILKYKLLPLIISLSVILITIILFFVFDFVIEKNKNFEQSGEKDNKNYHIVILGTYENQLFLEKLYEGAKSNGDLYNSIVELYVPKSKAQDKSLNELLDYATFVNADGVIAYINSANEEIPALYTIDATPIPLVTTGQYSADVTQISFIGNNYWELGNTIGSEAIELLEKKGMAFLISSEYSSNTTYSNMTNSIQAKLRNYEDVAYEVVNQNKLENEMDSIIQTVKDKILNNEKVLFVCLNEEDTIRTAQLISERKILSDLNVNLIGFGNNETCQGYFNKGIITELISLDPVSIGESAINQLFEYKNQGYANNYIAADVIIQKKGQ